MIIGEWLVCLFVLKFWDHEMGRRKEMLARHPKINRPAWKMKKIKIDEASDRYDMLTMW